MSGQSPQQLFDDQLFSSTPNEAESHADLSKVWLAKNKEVIAEDVLDLNEHLKNTTLLLTIVGKK